MSLLSHDWLQNTNHIRLSTGALFLFACCIALCILMHPSTLHWKRISLTKTTTRSGVVRARFNQNAFILGTRLATARTFQTKWFYCASCSFAPFTFTLYTGGKTDFTKHMAACSNDRLLKSFQTNWTTHVGFYIKYRFFLPLFYIKPIWGGTLQMQ